MPNHITNILTLQGETEAIEKCLSEIAGTEKDDDGTIHRHLIDFNSIIPMPPSLMITSGSSVRNAVALINNDENHFKGMLDYPWVKDEGMTSVEEVKEYFKRTLTEKEMEEGRKAVHNEKEYGCRDWYDWSIKNWGTKWNAYDQIKIEFGKIQFDTAWSTPYPVMEKIAKKYPELSLIVEFADEDIGNNCGRYAFKYGILVEEYLPSGNEAELFACEVKGIEPSSLVLDNLNYWEMDNFVRNRDTLVEMLEEDMVEEMLEVIDATSPEGVEKVKYLEALSVENELYEAASICRKMLSV